MVRGHLFMGCRCHGWSFGTMSLTLKSYQKQDTAEG